MELHNTKRQFKVVMDTRNEQSSVGVVSRPGLIGSLFRVVIPMILISIDGSRLAQGGLLFATISAT